MYASVRNSRVPRTHLEQQQQQQQRQQQQLSKNKKNNSSTKSSMKRMLFAYSAVGVVLCCVGECTSGHFYHYSHPYNPSTEEATVGESKAIWVAVSTPSKKGLGAWDAVQLTKYLPNKHKVLGFQCRPRYHRYICST